MLASNYPVDKHMGTSPERLTAGLQSVLAHLDQAAREQICVRTAAKFYRIEL
jgi:predicted TIM-barrel fold metal-dependent hydrolase